MIGTIFSWIVGIVFLGAFAWQCVVVWNSNEADLKLTAGGRAKYYGLTRGEYQREVAQRKLNGEPTINLYGKDGRGSKGKGINTL